ncbi:NUDIX hydrolase [Aggregatilinea sp.]|uniref:NUDIX hydrolase n=1 Tax=Aggregatilinea sp. TaxID=2806333 RepID=UPI002D1FBF30|nr:NUDIX hydrolase [Aggregatilinea sp.]
MVDHERPYRTLSSRMLWQSKWYSLRQDELADRSGERLTYTVVEKPDAVWIIPVTADGHIVLIDQYRYAIDEWCLEIPAGNIEPGVDPQAMAARELREEIGGAAERLVPVTEYFTMNGIGNERAHVYLALGVTLDEPERETTEHITLRVLPADEALRLTHEGAIKDGPSALALLLAEPAIRAYLAERDA